MYDELFEAWKKEKMNEEIQPLPKDFYKRLTEYIRKIREEQRMLDEKTVKGNLMKKEEENVRKMVEELIQTRHDKIIQIAREGRIPPTTNLTEEEENWFRDSSLRFESFKKFIEKILQGRLEKVENDLKGEFLVVRILREIPEIIGADMKTYGPFKPEDIASLPAENARILIKQGAAMEIEVLPKRGDVNNQEASSR